MMKRLLFFVLIGFASTPAAVAQQRPPGMSAIKKTDLKHDIYTMAADSMRGRRAGAIDELKAAAWVAEKARKIGLQPAGQNGSYFQFFSLHRTTVGGRSSIKINDRPLELWDDAWVVSPVEARLQGSVQWLDSMRDTTASLKGKTVAMNIVPPKKLPPKGMSLWAFRYGLSALRRQSQIMQRQGAKALILVADSTITSALPYLGLTFRYGSYQLNDRSSSESDDFSVILVRRKWGSALQGNDARISADIEVNKFTYPSANIVAKAPGSHPDLKNQYVLFSGHIDHEGVGMHPVKGDSIWNGADDNASTSVALMAIGRAWEKAPGKRSALFVWHGAEERGLFGSRYFVKHPTVPRESIVAVLNGDLFGRNSPDSAALLGAIPPHRNSKELVDMAMQANRQITQFTVDTSWDAPDHPEHWYFRSDHLPYARAGIPAIFFSSLLHPDYHTPQDNPDRINLDKLLKMTQWMYATGWKVAENKNQPALESEH